MHQWVRHSMSDHTVMAAMLALEAHADQKRMDGKPYIRHVRRVVGRVMARGYSGVFVQAAWLHDVVEDSDIDCDDLYEMGFEAEVVDAVAALTKDRNETYEEFIQRAKRNPIARVVKQADVDDHLAQDGAERFFKHSKYVAAKEALA